MDRRDFRPIDNKLTPFWNYKIIRMPLELIPRVKLLLWTSKMTSACWIRSSAWPCLPNWERTMTLYNTIRFSYWRHLLSLHSFQGWKFLAIHQIQSANVGKRLDHNRRTILRLVKIPFSSMTLLLKLIISKDIINLAIEIYIRSWSTVLRPHQLILENIRGHKNTTIGSFNVSFRDIKMLNDR